MPDAAPCSTQPGSARSSSAQRRQRVLLASVGAALLMAVLALNTLLWLPLATNGSFFQLRALRAEVAATRQQLQQLQLRNDALAADVRSLQDGLDGVEERARYDLGMIGRGETLYRILPPSARLQRAD